MSQSRLKKSLLTFAVIASALGAALAVGWAGGKGGARVDGVPLIVLCGALAFGIQWVAFIPAYIRQTERFYDLTGSLTYVAVTACALLFSGSYDARSLFLTALVLIWATRLGTFLFRRIRSEGSDSRFDDIKPSFSRFFVAWTLQGLWVFLTLCAALAAMTTLEPTPLGYRDLVGAAIWAIGFGIEVTADRQKKRFRSRNPGRFINEGLWAWSRHPNYFGEIVLWVGVAVIASSTLTGWQWVTMVSPLFVFLLLTRVSGIPILERRAEDRWGHRDDYQRYKARTPVLIPKPPKA